MNASRGFSFIELMVVVAIAGVLLALGVSSFQTMMGSSRTRAAAESVYSGLQLARAEAIKRNTTMRFHLVSDMTSSCVYSPTSMLWIVSQTDLGSHGQVAGFCNSEAWVPPDQLDPCNPDHGKVTCDIVPAPAGGCFPRPAANPSACSSDPWIAFKSPANVHSDVTVAAVTAPGSGTTASAVTFGPMGQVVGNGSGIGVERIGYLLFTHATVTDAKSWAVRVNTTTGSIKFCDPALAAGQPLACS